MSNEDVVDGQDTFSFDDQPDAEKRWALSSGFAHPKLLRKKITQVENIHFSTIFVFIIMTLMAWTMWTFLVNHRQSHASIPEKFLNVNRISEPSTFKIF